MVTATARANIALVKYWGKRDRALNIPAAGSLSLTLDRLETRTTVTTIDGESDRLVLDGQAVVGKPLHRITKFVDLVRTATGRSERVLVESSNAFPTAAGLASSASAFAALAVAASKAFDYALDDKALSILARQGSGSAARSIFGDFARMTDGDDAHAFPLDLSVDLSAAIAVARSGPKSIGSTDGMELTKETSPYHAAWIDTVNRDLDVAQSLLEKGDLAQLAEIVEGNCLAMHANAMAARPGIIYFRAATLWAIERVRSLRASGTPVFFTIDAGPHVVAFTPEAHLDRVRQELGDHPDVAEVITSGPGAGAQVES